MGDIMGSSYSYKYYISEKWLDECINEGSELRVKELRYKKKLKKYNGRESELKKKYILDMVEKFLIWQYNFRFELTHDMRKMREQSTIRNELFQAYKLGEITREECDKKHSPLEGTAEETAFRDMYNSKQITEDEYRKKVSPLRRFYKNRQRTV